MYDPLGGCTTCPNCRGTNISPATHQVGHRAQCDDCGWSFPVTPVSYPDN